MYRSSKPHISLLQLFTLSILIFSCSPKKYDYAATVYQTSQSGDNLKLITENPRTETKGNSKKVSLLIKTDQKFQEYVGFGASFTESSAWNLATIPKTLRKDFRLRGHTSIAAIIQIIITLILNQVTQAFLPSV
jgi:glucosylceramidase